MKQRPEGPQFTLIELLVVIAIIALVIGRACEDWWTIRLGWLNLVLGPVLIVGGFALVSWSVLFLYKLGKGTPSPRVATQRLVRQGLYTYTRNPMTLGALLLYLGIGFLMGSGVVVLLTLVVFSALLTFIYIHETRELGERFGEQYLEYKKQTPFLLPRFMKRN